MAGGRLEITGGDMVMRTIETKREGRVTGEFKCFAGSWFWLTHGSSGFNQEDIEAVATKLRELNNTVAGQNEPPTLEKRVEILEEQVRQLRELAQSCKNL